MEEAYVGVTTTCTIPTSIVQITHTIIIFLHYLAFVIVIHFLDRSSSIAPLFLFAYVTCQSQQHQHVEFSAVEGSACWP
jgi:hypothetical protein